MFGGISTLIHTIQVKPTTTRSNPFIIPKSISVQCRPYNRALLYAIIFMNLVPFFVSRVFYIYSNSVQSTTGETRSFAVDVVRTVQEQPALQQCGAICIYSIFQTFRQQDKRAKGFPGRSSRHLLSSVLCAFWCLSVKISRTR